MVVDLRAVWIFRLAIRRNIVKRDGGRNHIRNGYVIAALVRGIRQTCASLVLHHEQFVDLKYSSLDHSDLWWMYVWDCHDGIALLFTESMGTSNCWRGFYRRRFHVVGCFLVYITWIMVSLTLDLAITDSLGKAARAETALPPH